MTERMAFALAVLSDPANAPHPISGCDRGHLVVGGNSHWAPETLSADLRTLTCRLIERCET